jgi:hypothetical protein
MSDDASFFDPSTPLPLPPKPHPGLARLVRKMAQALSLLIVIATVEIVRGVLLVVLYLPARYILPFTALAALAELHVAATAHQHSHPLLVAEALASLLATGLLAYGLPRFYRRLQVTRLWRV